MCVTVCVYISRNIYIKSRGSITNGRNGCQTDSKMRERQNVQILKVFSSSIMLMKEQMANHRAQHVKHDKGIRPCYPARKNGASQRPTVDGCHVKLSIYLNWSMAGAIMR